MDYIILIGVIGFLALSAFVGYKKGMVKIVLSMVALTCPIIDCKSIATINPTAG